MKSCLVVLLLILSTLTASAQATPCFGFGPPAGNCTSGFLWPDTSLSKSVLLNESFAGSSLPANWAVFSGGSWTVSNGLISPASGQGYGAIMTYSQYYSLEQRTIRVQFQVLTAGTVVGIGSVNSSTAFDSSGESLFTVDASANTLNIGNHWVHGTNTGVAASVPLGFSITTGQIYTLSLTQNMRQFIATIADPASGKVATVSSGDNVANLEPWGYLEDFPSIVAVAGQFKINNFRILANAASPQAMFLGDSITWGVGLTMPQAWTQIVGVQLPKANFLVSGRPGGSSFGALGATQSEAQFVLPKYLVLMIGTNDAAGLVTLSQYQTNINAIVTLANSVGIQVIICTVPTNGNSTQQTEINLENAFLLGLSGVTFVRADIATSIGGDGHTQDTSLFQSDRTHPNTAGSAAITARFHTDAPQIFQ